MTLRSSFPFRFAFEVTLLLTTSLLPLQADQPQPGPRPPLNEGEPFLRDGNGLTPEERDHVRRVFSRVWTQPEVTAAREAVHEATVHYREAIWSAVEKEDPSVVPLMEKMHRDIRSSAGKHGVGPGTSRRWPGPPPPPLPKDPKAALERLLEHDSALEPLEPTLRMRFLRLAHDSMEAKELQDLLASAIRADAPPESIAARRRFRDRLFRAMSERDPWVEEVLRNAPSRDRTFPAGDDRPPPQPPRPPGSRDPRDPR